MDPLNWSVCVCSFLFHIQLASFFTFMLERYASPDAGKDKSQSKMGILFENLMWKKLIFYVMFSACGTCWDEICFPKYCCKNLVRILSIDSSQYLCSESRCQTGMDPCCPLYKHSEVLGELSYMSLLLNCSHGSLTAQFAQFSMHVFLRLWDMIM